MSTVKTTLTIVSGKTSGDLRVTCGETSVFNKNLGTYVRTGPRMVEVLTLKAPITTAADDSHKYFFIVFQRKSDLMFQVNPLLDRGST